MAMRPLFLPRLGITPSVDVVDIEFVWHSGFAPSQKAKSRDAMHAAAKARGFGPILEVSTKSDVALGQALSAFHLKIPVMDHGLISVESAFQGSKVFSGSGPSEDLYGLDARSAKKISSTRNQGDLTHFQFEGCRWELEPKTAFYDWLYMRALSALPQKMLNELRQFRGFTDIEFNPTKAFNCQARSCALAVALMKHGVFEAVTQSRQQYRELVLDPFLDSNEGDPNFMQAGLV